MKLRVILAAVAGLASFAIGQADAAPQTCEGADYRAFDFWLGTWNVTLPDGRPAGVNAVTSEEHGCLIVERWTSASGGTGRSYNFYSPDTGKWRQVWVNLGAVIDYEGGLTATGSMKLVGEIAYRDGTVAPFTGEWTLNPDGTVTQHFEEYDAETGTWEDWFTGVYAKAELDTAD